MKCHLAQCSAKPPCSSDFGSTGAEVAHPALGSTSASSPSSLPLQRRLEVLLEHLAAQLLAVPRRPAALLHCFQLGARPHRSSARQSHPQLAVLGKLPWLLPGQPADAPVAAGPGWTPLLRPHWARTATLPPVQRGWEEQEQESYPPAQLLGGEVISHFCIRKACVHVYILSSLRFLVYVSCKW